MCRRLFTVLGIIFSARTERERERGDFICHLKSEPRSYESSEEGGAPRSSEGGGLGGEAFATFVYSTSIEAEINI